MKDARDFGEEYKDYVLKTLVKEQDVKTQISEIVIKYAVEVNNSFLEDNMEIYARNKETYQREDEDFKRDEYEQTNKLAMMKFEIEY